MMPTIQPSGEIILVEKITHRIYGLNGGDDGHKRAKDSQMKQLEWEKKESRLWLGGGRVGGLEGGKGTSSSTKPSSPSSSKTPSVHTWYESKLKEVNPINYRDLSSLSQCYSKLTSGIAVGDVVVMRHPNRDGTVCKRVLGLPGDIIIRPKKTSSQYYNSFSTMNQRQEQQQKRESHRDVMNVFQNDSDDEKRDKKYSNAKKNAAVDRTSNIISSSSFSCMPSLHNSSLIVIPNGHVWLEGDNSINSSDSRNYGPQPASLVVGKVLMRLWPFSGNALMVRGGCPVPPKGRPFTGSTRLPAGYDGQTIRNID
jgi:signal peptidase I